MMIIMVFSALDFLVIIISALNQMANLVKLVLTGYIQHDKLVDALKKYKVIH